MELPAPPLPLRNLLARLPQYPPAAIIALALNAVLGESLNAKNLPQARGKVVTIDVRDIGLKLAFAVEDEGLVARGNVRPDATISADARDFLALARREQDPDTLFFNRRLVMQGDTELALLIKNTLDAIDFRALKLPPPSRVLGAVALQLRAWL
ncbi:MAG: SCP2 sterol-binding domain-containing protein [Betaproteobacteria bacterium]|nr:SCP2 sterol-binding domain-containing protein [Betaproteobacteria bacterium]